MCSFARIALVAAFLWAPAALAQVTTSLQPPDCVGAPGNEAARRHDHGAVTYFCTGAGGWRVKLTYFGVNVSADFTPAGARAPIFTLRAPFDIGPRIEWHGAGKGAPPQAAIVRLHARTDTGGRASALAILAVSSARVCLAGLIDGGAQDANARARNFARLVMTQGCGREPQVIGPSTATIEELRDVNR